MATDYRNTQTEGSRARWSLIPAAVTAAVGAVLIGGLVWGAGRGEDLKSPAELGRPATTGWAQDAAEVRQTREQTIEGTMSDAR